MTAIYGFEFKVLERLRQDIPRGNIHASVSHRFAQTWLDSLDVVNSTYQRPGDISKWEGASDGEGTLTYEYSPTGTAADLEVGLNTLDVLSYRMDEFL